MRRAPNTFNVINTAMATTSSGGGRNHSSVIKMATSYSEKIKATSEDSSCGGGFDPMEGRKWEELNMDCLVNIFRRVGLESLILDIPFVCKSWYKATLSPLCWQRLIFPKMSVDLWWDDEYDQFTSRLMDEYHVLKGHFSVTAFMKFVISRSRGSAATIKLPVSCTEQALLYIADECPALKALVMPYDISHDCMSMIPNLISKWKNLEQLGLGKSFNMQEILAQISIHCKNFVALGVPSGNIGKDEASAIVTLLPNIKYLVLREASIERENLVMILQGCKKLVNLDARDCIGFEGDEEILKLASHIRTFKCEGSRAEDWDDYVDTINYRNDGFHDGNISD